MAKKIALVVGIVLVLVGIVGWMPNSPFGTGVLTTPMGYGIVLVVGVVLVIWGVWKKSPKMPSMPSNNSMPPSNPSM